MHVRGDQPRDKDVAGEVDYFVVGVFGLEDGSFVDVGYVAGLRAEGAVGEDRAGRGEGKDCGVGEEHFGLWFGFGNRSGLEWDLRLEISGY